MGSPTEDRAAVRRRAEEAGQGHLFELEPGLDETTRSAFHDELARVDWDLVAKLAKLVSAPVPAGAKVLEPAPSIVKGGDETADARARARGEELLRAGRVAVFLVAGGQGSRLGYDGPKGCYPATPVRAKSLFQLFAEKIHALGAGPGRRPPWFIMTSRANHEATCAFFEEHDYFGLDRDTGVVFFSQDMLPAIDEDGRLLLSAPGELFLSPNGHGGSLLALRSSGALDAMRERGIDQIFYMQVDNPLVQIADPVFIGYHDLERADMSTKVVPKRDAHEKVGVLGLIDGRYGVIEYSDLSDEERLATAADGGLRFRDGNIAVHAIRRDFVETLTRDGLDLPYHLARKAIPCIDPATGARRTVDGVKFETFVFDALAACERSVVLSVDRAEEFAPIKNAEGEDSPASSREAQSAMFAAWLERAGVAVPRGVDGAPRHAIEIAPRFADSADALASRRLDGLATGGDLYVE